MRNGLILLLIGLSGCLIVQSEQPFYTSDLKTALPAVLGEWDETDTPRNDTGRRIRETWGVRQETDYRVRVYGSDGPAESRLVFFTVAGRLYCDWQHEQDTTHQLYQTTLARGQLTLTPLDGDWLTNAIAHATVDLPPPACVHSNWTFTASSQQWVAFLRQHGGQDGVLAKGQAITLKKSPDQNFVPLRRS